MPEPTAPDQQASAPDQQENWKARYDGLVRKVEQLTLDNRRLTDELTTKTSETEQLRAQLSVKDTEKSAAISERDKQLQDAIQSKTSTENELQELRAFRMKVDVARKLGKPQLLKILDKIPAMTDEAALTTVLNDFAAFADDAAAERERQLLSGITPTLNSQAKSANQPSSAAEWERYINSLPPGSKERQDAFDRYWDWGSKQNS